MNAVRLAAATQFRQRVRDLALLALLVAVVSGSVMASVVASNRAASSIERFLDWSVAASAAFPMDVPEPELLIDALVSHPDVQGVSSSRALSVFVPDGSANPFGGAAFNLVADNPLGTGVATGTFGIDVERPLLLEGRMPSPDRAEEILLLEWFARTTGWQVGDRISGLTIAAADLDDVFDQSTPFPGMNGPRLDLVVVGIGRSGPEIAGTVGSNTMGAYASAALLMGTADALWWPPTIAVHTRTGATEHELAEALASQDALPVAGATFGGEFVGGVTDARASAIETATSAVDTMAFGLAVFAVGAWIAGATLIVQAVTRHLGDTAGARATLLQLGQSPRDTALAATIPIAGAAGAGAVLGAVGAIVASRHLPTGLARRAEVDPGIWVRADLLAPIGVAFVLFASAVAFTAAYRRVRRSNRAAAASLPIPTWRLEPTPAISTGVRMALQRSHGPRAIPNRTAFAGLAVAVVGAVSALVLVDSVDSLTETPARWGWNWSSSPSYVGTRQRDDLQAVATEPGVESIGTFLANGVSLDGSPIGGFAVEPLVGELSFSLREGRLPQAPGEVALGARTLRRLDIAIGDSATLADFSGNHERRVTVVGGVVFPFEVAETVDDGVAMLPETLFDVTDEGTAQLFPIMRYVAGADPSAIEARLESAHDLVFDPLVAPRPPAVVQNLAVTKQVAVALALLFLAFALLATSHAIVVASARRRFDLSVLRALGFVRGQVRTAINTQATVIAVVAVAIGVPLGLAAGRAAWRSVTVDAGVVASLEVPWLRVLTVVPLTAMLAVALAMWPSRDATRHDPARVLRAE